MVTCFNCKNKYNAKKRELISKIRLRKTESYIDPETSRVKTTDIWGPWNDVLNITTEYNGKKGILRLCPNCLRMLLYGFYIGDKRHLHDPPNYEIEGFDLKFERGTIENET